MTIYVIQAYDGADKADVFYSTKKTQIRDFFGIFAFENNFDEDFDIVGYAIPKNIENKYKKNPDAIYSNWVINKDHIEDVNESVVFYQVWNKKVA